MNHLVSNIVLNEMSVSIIAGGLWEFISLFIFKKTIKKMETKCFLIKHCNYFVHIMVIIWNKNSW